MAGVWKVDELRGESTVSSHIETIHRLDCMPMVSGIRQLFSTLVGMSWQISCETETGSGWSWKSLVRDLHACGSGQMAAGTWVRNSRLLWLSSG